MVKAIEIGFGIPNNRSISVITPLSIRRGVGGEAERGYGCGLLVLWVRANESRTLLICQ